MQPKLGFVCGNYLVSKAINDKKLWVIDGDLADSDGAEPFAQAYPERFIAAGIAEQNMVSMAAGLATTGKHPWVFSFAAFLCYRAYDQIRTCISQTKLPVILVGSHAGACGGRNGKTHITLNDIAIMASLPNIDIWAPTDTQDTKYAIDCLLKENRAAYLRLPRDPQPEITTHNKVIQWLGEPCEIAILSYGLSTHWALATQKILQAQGYRIGVLHFCRVWPIDRYELEPLIHNVKHCFLLEDHYAFGGLHTCLQTTGLDIKTSTLSWPANWLGQSGATKVMLEKHNLAPEQLAKLLLKKLT